MTDYFPTSYEDSRERFKLSLSLLQSKWPDARLESHPLKEHPDLSIDWIWAEPPKKENLVIISTAEHGIEGYVGAAMMKVFIEEFAPQLNPENTGLLLVHAINPWGMKHRYRVNPNNVDLNRNFVFYELLRPGCQSGLRFAYVAAQSAEAGAKPVAGKYPVPRQKQSKD